MLAQSGGLSADWPIEKVLRTGDVATGTTVLEDLYAKYKDQPVTPDLMGLWKSLGIEASGASVALNDSAARAPRTPGDHARALKRRPPQCPVGEYRPVSAAVTHSTRTTSAYSAASERRSSCTVPGAAPFQRRREAQPVQRRKTQECDKQ